MNAKTKAKAKAYVFLDDQNDAATFGEALSKSAFFECTYVPAPKDGETEMLPSDAFLTILNADEAGIAAAKRLKELSPHPIIVFSANTDEYLTQALMLRADFYLLKPYSPDEASEILRRAERLFGSDSYEAAETDKKRVYIHTFGRFDVFVDEKPIRFTSAKAKELLALLVDRNGGILTSEQAFSYLWEDKEYGRSSQSLYRKVAQRLNKNLAKAGISDILITEHTSRYLDTLKYDSDYKSMLAGSAEAAASFAGEYMAEYSWSEYRIDAVSSIAENVKNQKKK